MPGFRLRTYENGLVLMMTLAMGFTFLSRFSIVYLLPFIGADLHWSNTQMGFLVSLLSLTWAISGFVLGAYSDRSGNRKGVLIVALIVFSLSSILSGVAAAFAVMAFSRLVMGAAQGPVLPVAQSLMAAESSEKRRGLNMGLVQNLGSGLFGAIIAPVLIVAIAQAWGWRAAFYLCGVPGLLMVPVLARYVREVDSPSGPALVGDSLGEAPHTPVAQLLRNRDLQVCIALSCLLSLWGVVQITFLPVHFVKVLGLSGTQMGLLMSLRGVSALVAGIFVPALSDRIGRKPALLIFSALSAVSPIAMVSTGLTFGTLVFISLISGAGIGCLPLSMATIPAEIVPPRQLGTVLGLTMGLAEVLGGFVGPSAAGVAADLWGSSAPLWIAGMAAVAATVAAMFLRETRPAHAPDAAIAVS